MTKPIMLVGLLCGLCGLAAATPTFACPSEVTLNIHSSNYSGTISIEMRSGKRPGSKVVDTGSVYTQGTQTFHDVCAGRYFFAFATPGSDVVSVTRYFDIVDDGESYSMPIITVTYSHVSGQKAQKVGSARKRDL